MPIIWGPFSPTEIAQLDHLNASMQRYMHTWQPSVSVPKGRARHTDGEHRHDRSACWREILADPDDLGPSWDDAARARMHSAIHECGHVVALLALGRADAIDGVEIFDEQHTDGTRAEVSYLRSRLDDDEQRILLAAACAATMRWSGTASGAALDFDELERDGVDVGDTMDGPFCAVTESGDMRRLRATAARTIAPHWACLMKLSRLLFARGALSGDEIRATWAAWLGDRTGLALAAIE